MTDSVTDVVTAPERSRLEARVVLRLGVLAVLVLAALLQLGTTGRHSSLGHLLSDLQNGRTHSVLVVGDRVLWRTEDGVLPQRVDLTDPVIGLPTPDRSHPEQAAGAIDAPSLRGLIRAYPGMPLDPVRSLPPWAQPQLLLLLAGLGTALVFFSGPQPWHFNRWGWFWVLGIGAQSGVGIGLAAYLLLSGPLPWRRREEPAVRRTGGVGFVWGVVLGSIANLVLFGLQQVLLPGVLGGWGVRTA